MTVKEMAGALGWRLLAGEDGEDNVIAVSYTHLTLPTIA